MTTTITYKGRIIPHKTFAKRYEEFLIRTVNLSSHQAFYSARNVLSFLASMEEPEITA